MRKVSIDPNRSSDWDHSVAIINGTPVTFRIVNGVVVVTWESSNANRMSDTMIGIDGI